MLAKRIWEASCPKTQTNSRLARRAVSIVIDPWRAPVLGSVGGDVGDSGSPYAQGKHRSATRCHAPGRRPGSRPRAAPGPERASRLRRGSPGLDSGPLVRPLFRRCTALSATRSPVLCQNSDSHDIPKRRPTALGDVANTDTKLLICSLFQKSRVLAQDGVEDSSRDVRPGSLLKAFAAYPEPTPYASCPNTQTRCQALDGCALHNNDR